MSDSSNDDKIVYLVSRVSVHSDKPAPARELYISPWYERTRKYVEAQGKPWWLLSAEYGLVHPDTEIEPYDTTLRRMSDEERDAWFERVLDQIDEALDGDETIIMLAGFRYREPLLPALEERGYDVQVPLLGMSMEEKLAWLSEP